MFLLLRYTPKKFLNVCSVLMLLQLGCYYRHGGTYTTSPSELIEQSKRACQRNDERASQAFLQRLTQSHPDSEEAVVARRAIAARSSCIVVRTDE